MRALTVELKDSTALNIIVRHRADGSIDLASPPATYIRAGNRQSVIDYCATEINKTASKAKGELHIHMEGFDSSEDTAMLESIRYRSTAEIEGFYDLERGNALNEFDTVLAKELDFPRAKLLTSVDDTGIDGASDVPLIGKSGSARLSVSVRVKNAPKTLLEKLGAAVTTSFDRLKAKVVDRDALFAFRREIKSTADQLKLTSPEVTVRLKTAAADAYFVDQPEPSLADTRLAQQ